MFSPGPIRAAGECAGVPHFLSDVKVNPRAPSACRLLQAQLMVSYGFNHQVGLVACLVKFFAQGYACGRMIVKAFNSEFSEQPLLGVMLKRISLSQFTRRSGGFAPELQCGFQPWAQRLPAPRSSTRAPARRFQNTSGSVEPKASNPISAVCSRIRNSAWHRGISSDRATVRAAAGSGLPGGSSPCPCLHHTGGSGQANQKACILPKKLSPGLSLRRSGF